MPQALPISVKDKARRHVLGQQLYRLRMRYKFLKRGGMILNAQRVMTKIHMMTLEYDALGGRPHHRGNRV